MNCMHLSLHYLVLTESSIITARLYRLATRMEGGLCVVLCRVVSLWLGDLAQRAKCNFGTVFTIFVHHLDPCAHPTNTIPPDCGSGLCSSDFQEYDDISISSRICFPAPYSLRVSSSMTLRSASMTISLSLRRLCVSWNASSSRSVVQCEIVWRQAVTIAVLKSQLNMVSRALKDMRDQRIWRTKV
jgi:hypothetical protein